LEYRESVLVVIRGNSGSGKSTVARELRTRHGRGCALIDQDYLRRVLLRERDLPGGLAPELIARIAWLALGAGYHVVLEGILAGARYRDVLTDLAAAHRGRSCFFYLDVGWEETVRRHATRPQASQYTVEEMRAWYTERDLLGVAEEHVVPESSSVEETLAFIVATSGLAQEGRDTDYLPLAAEIDE
jgi:predicted kinase